MVVACALLGAAPPPDAAPPDPRGFVGYLEWMLDVGATAAQLDEARALVAQAWIRKDPFEMRLVLRGIELEKDLAHHTQAERDALRSSVEDEYFKTLHRRGKGLPLAGWIDRLRASARTPIVRGDPPLTRQAAAALAEVFAWIGGTASPADFTRALVAAHPQLSPEHRRAIANAPRAWARLRGRPDAEQAQWRRAFHEAWPSLDLKQIAVAAPRLAEALTSARRRRTLQRSRRVRRAWPRYGRCSPPAP